ncbi:Fic family protein [Candidatus Neomarinimicrobiota bacterium]
MKLPQIPPSTIPSADGDWYKAIAALYDPDLNTKIDPLPNGKYLHWDKLSQLDPPAGIDAKTWWIGIKLARRALYQSLPLVDSEGCLFKFAPIELLNQLVWEIDRGGTGKFSDGSSLNLAEVSDSQYTRSLLDEAITSSQLEGAATTAAVAREMLLDGRRPQDKHEWMIHNNYVALEYIRDLKGVPLTENIVLDLHKILTNHTLDDEAAVGCYRSADEDIKVIDVTDGTVLHQPPQASELPDRMARLCDFANGVDGQFIHPVLRAVMLHFQLAYDHPFVDGNGRTARALFYWAMARYDYWLCEYISISSILLQAPSKYARAFLYTETDESDLTYFLEYNLNVISKAISILRESIADNAQQLGKATDALGSNPIYRSINGRQQGIISYALDHPGFLFTIEAHRKLNTLSYQTARTDLLGLAELGLLDMHKRGRAFIFGVPTDLKQRLEGP